MNENRSTEPIESATHSKNAISGETKAHLGTKVNPGTRVNLGIKVQLG
jgi:hypothetical protein